jgi:hypothetical protein
MSATAQFDPEARVDPDDWYVLRPFMHEGLTYGRNEQVPETLSGHDILGLLRIGILARIKPDGTIERPVMPKPDSPAAYLRYSDSQVLRVVRQHPPAPDDLLQVATLARQQRRSVLLVDALDAMAGVPVAPPRGVVTPQAGELQQLHDDLRVAVNSLEDERQQHALLRTEHESLQDEHRKLKEQIAEHNASTS